MLEPRALKSHEMDSAIEFLNKNLRDKTNWSIENEYPLAIGPHNKENMFVIKDENSIISHALAKYLVLKTPLGLIKVATIGSVVTNESFRNQGYSQKVLKSCLDKATQDHCDLAILWTDLYDFYRQLGFELAGSEYSYRLDTPLPQENTQLKYIKGSSISAEALLKVFSQHTVSSVRSLEDIRKFLKIPNSNVYSAWDTSGQLKAYAIEGKGADLTGYIHEWGGSVTDLLSLLRFMQDHQKNKLTLIASHHNQGLVRKLESLGLNHHSGYLGMIKLLKPDALFKKVTQLAQGVTHKNFYIKAQGEKFIFGVDNKSYETNNEQDIVQILFGPQKASDLFNFDEKTKDVMEAVFPLPLWIWGWDSV